MLHGPTLNLGDITKIDPRKVPDCDLLTYSFPCTDISIAGKQLGLKNGSGTRSSLLWECEKIIKAKRPKYLLMENVKNLTNSRHIKDFEKWIEVLASFGYKNYWKVLNAVDYGSVQSRERVYMVSILGEENYEFPRPAQKKLRVKDILDKEFDEKNLVKQPYTLYENPVVNERTGLITVASLDKVKFIAKKNIYSPDGSCPTLNTMQGGSTEPKFLVEGVVRKLNPRECWRAMGWTDEQFNRISGVSNTQLKKQAGNGICIPVLERIFENLFKENKINEKK